MKRMSSNPAVVNRAVLPPSLSSTAFVANVVPWVMMSGGEGRDDRPLETASSGLAGVDGTLNDLRLVPSMYTKSVKVPPMSQPSCRAAHSMKYYRWVNADRMAGR